MVMRRLSPLVVLLTMAGCSMAPGMYVHTGQFEEDGTVQAEELPVTLIPITHETIARQVQPTAEQNGQAAALEARPYRIGPQDVLSIIVWGHPELTIPTGGQRPAEVDGHRVSSDGTIFYPYVGEIEVNGLTEQEVRQRITEGLSRYIKEPQLDVRVVSFNSQKVHLSGEVAEQGILPVTDIPLTLSSAITASGGATEKAALDAVVLVRGEERSEHDLVALFQYGDLSQDVLLRDGDRVHVPMNTRNKVFVMGEVKQPAAIPLIEGQLSLAEVLSTGGIDQNAADPEQIFILRQEQGNATAYHLDASEPGALILATAFPMQALDVVFVSTSNLSRWNRVLTQLLPTVQTLWTVERAIETQ